MINGQFKKVTEKYIIKKGNWFTIKKDTAANGKAENYSYQIKALPAICITDLCPVRNSRTIIHSMAYMHRIRMHMQA